MNPRKTNGRVSKDGANYVGMSRQEAQQIMNMALSNIVENANFGKQPKKKAKR